MLPYAPSIPDDAVPGILLFSFTSKPTPPRQVMLPCASRRSAAHGADPERAAFCEPTGATTSALAVDWKLRQVGVGVDLVAIRTMTVPPVIVAPAPKTVPPVDLDAPSATGS